MAKRVVIDADECIGCESCVELCSEVFAFNANISAYTLGVVGYRTPNIDRIAKEGMIFTDYYAEQSCTAGRSSFIMGQRRPSRMLAPASSPHASLVSRATNARH